MDRSDNAKQISRADRQLSMHPRLRLRGGRSGSCFHFAPVGNGGGGQAKIELMYNTVTVSSSVRDASSGPTPLHPKVQEIDFVSKQKKKKKSTEAQLQPFAAAQIRVLVLPEWLERAPSHKTCSAGMHAFEVDARSMLDDRIQLAHPLQIRLSGCKGLVRISSRIDAMCRRHHQLHARWDLRPAAASVAAASVVVATSVCRPVPRPTQAQLQSAASHSIGAAALRCLPRLDEIVLPLRAPQQPRREPAPPPFLLTPSLFHPSLPFVSKTNLLLPIMSKVTASGIIAGNISTQRVKLNNGVEIPQVALGVYKAPNDGSTENACKWAFDAGYRHIDSECLTDLSQRALYTLCIIAARYMNEESVGRALAEWTQANNVPRSQIFITSKLWDADHDKAAAAIEDSLKKLQVEYMDMYLMHSPGTMGPEKRLEAWKALEEAVDAGKIKTIGVSNFDVEELDHLLANCRIKPAVNQIESHPFFAHEELREACIERGIHIQAYSPMAQGQALDRPEIKAIATKHGKTPAQ
ncbi:ribosomal protein S4 [Moesziomyces antarcticus T-34]|uniref:Ribosomal protein S4 n=1 Tax=Pseudozyma antarctica (strain T-34) TaxID=1151754 RepID=M9LWY9_PSEA3|nr:ribosomal protein S4 [Moesziomyces antarcticus T-34]